MVRRRKILIALGCGAVTAALQACSRSEDRVHRIGYLHPGTPQDPGRGFATMQQALAGLGYKAGANLKFEERWADGRLEDLPRLAAELAALKVDVIVAVSPSAIRAAQSATATIPIVMAFSGSDPVKSGFIASLARPGGNITGVTSVPNALGPKWFELLQDARPETTRVAVLRNPARPDHAEQVEFLQAAAAPRGVRLQGVSARDSGQYEAAFDDMTRERAEGVIILSGPEYSESLGRLAELCIAHRLMSVWQFRNFVAAGGLFSYGPDIEELTRRAAAYVDRILRGANPAEMPVEQPTKFKLAINLKTAQALGLVIPRALLLRADEVIR